MSTEMQATHTEATSIETLLRLRDLTDPTEGVHCVQLVVDTIEAALTTAWSIPARRDPGERIVRIADNYDRLRYPPDAVTRDRRYSHYVDSGQMLRSHTTARIPALLDDLTRDDNDILLSVPGICYRRDVIDRHHVGEPHQLDLWRIRLTGPPLTGDDLEGMARVAVTSVLPGHEPSTVPNVHPYTVDGREIYVDGVEVGECGVAHPEVLAGAGLPSTASGLAMGLGLDRLTMLAKGIDDIRLLRSTDGRVLAQLADLTPYRPVSRQPATWRDISVAVDGALDAEQLGDRIRGLLGPRAGAVEEVRVLGETRYEELPDSARIRMGMTPGQKNILLRLSLRDLDRTLTADEANILRDRIYAGLHEGSAHEWAGVAVRP
jgi:phenylalanyl-tRNA synthetase alpha chain